MTKPNDRASKTIGHVDRRLIKLMQLGPIGAVLGGPLLVAALARQAPTRPRLAPPTRLPPQTRVAPPPKRPPPPRQQLSDYAVGRVYEPLLQGDTAMRGAASMFFGNEASAAMDSTVRRGAPTWRGRYADNYAAEKARDAYDAAHRPVAQTVGQLSGLTLAMLLTRGRVPVARLPGAAKLSGREVSALLGTGALAGLGSQAVADLLTGNKSSAGDLQAAAMGGLVNTALLPFGAKWAAGAGGATTSLAQDLFNGRPVSLERLGQAYNLARVTGGLGDDAGTNAANRLSPRDKGRLGEQMGSLRSTVNTQMREPGPKTLEKYAEPGGRVRGTYPDGRSGELRFEDKFGPTATLSPGQLAAQAALGDNYKLYHFLAQDAGAATSLAPALAGGQVVLERPWPRALDEVIYEDALSRAAGLPQATAVQARGW